MNFLLILSAVLSAVTGAFAGARPPEARLHHQASAQVAPVARVAAQVAVPAARIAAPRPFALPVLAEAPPVLDVAAAVPLYADRLIE